MSESTQQHTVPRALIHKKILAAAEERPDASLEELAAAVPSAPVELVERVLDEYGDPGTGVADETAEPAATSMPSDQPVPDVEDLSSTQRETLASIAEHPDATQREIGDMLDVSASTVSNRVNAIDGFDWADRAAFVDAVREHDLTTTPETPMSRNSTNGTKSESRVEQLAQRVEALEATLEDQSGVEPTPSPFGPAELTHKVLHACLTSDHITEDEELQILQALVR